MYNILAACTRRSPGNPMKELDNELQQNLYIMILSIYSLYNDVISVNIDIVNISYSRAVCKLNFI